MKVLPVKFESILRTGDLQIRPLILKVDSDLTRFERLARFNRAQQAGSLAVVQSGPGKGKTTAVYAASVLMNDKFNTVLSVPPLISLPLREIPTWLASNLPQFDSKRVTPVLIDGRESTDDAQGLRDLMGALNNVVRGRPDLLFVWPTTSELWQGELVRAAREFGSSSFCPDHAVFSVDGPSRDRWVEAVSLILNQLSSSWDELGVNESTANEIVDNYDTLGDFFTGLNTIRVEQEDFAAGVTGLPEVVFVVSSHSDVVGHVARLRNPRNYLVRTDELISSARQSRAGKFWRDKGAKQNSNLAWVSSLLQVKLVALTPSTVAHACGIESSEGSDLKVALAGLEFQASRGTGKTAFKTTDLARFLKGESVPEVLSSNKGKTSQSTLEAYDAIQALSSRRHKEINKCILDFAGTVDGVFDPKRVEYELPLGGDAIVDAVVPMNDRRVHFEFHHLSKPSCTPNKIASYIMGKLQVYAYQFNLVER